MKHRPIVTFLRIIHTLIVIYLVTGIFYIYYCAITKTTDVFLTIFITSLGIEGVVVYTNKGKCPFGYIQRMFGDHTPFFDLILPNTYAKYAVKFCAVVTLIGMGLLCIRFIL